MGLNEEAGIVRRSFSVDKMQALWARGNSLGDLKNTLLTIDPRTRDTEQLDNLAKQLTELEMGLLGFEVLAAPERNGSKESSGREEDLVDPSDEELHQAQNQLRRDYQLSTFDISKVAMGLLRDSPLPKSQDAVATYRRLVHQRIFFVMIDHMNDLVTHNKRIDPFRLALGGIFRLGPELFLTSGRYSKEKGYLALAYNLYRLGIKYCGNWPEKERQPMVDQLMVASLAVQLDRMDRSGIDLTDRKMAEETYHAARRLAHDSLDAAVRSKADVFMGKAGLLWLASLVREAERRVNADAYYHVPQGATNEDINNAIRQMRWKGIQIAQDALILAGAFDAQASVYGISVDEFVHRLQAAEQKLWKKLDTGGPDGIMHILYAYDNVRTRT